MDTLPSIYHGYAISVGPDFQRYVKETRTAFWELSRKLSPLSQETPTSNVIQLQRLHYLMKKGLLELHEGPVRDGVAFLFLKLRSKESSSRYPEEDSSAPN